MTFVRPISIASPTGSMVKPRIVEKRVGDQIHCEAHWYDPNNGVLFHRGTVEIKDVEKK